MRGWGFAGLLVLGRCCGCAFLCRVFVQLLQADDDSIDAEEAYRIGLLNRKNAQGGALAEALKITEVYADRAPLSLSHMKRAVRRGIQMDLASGIDLESALGALLMGTQDRQEGLSSFLQKRKPQFKGS